MAGYLAFALYPPLVSHDMLMKNQLQRKNCLVKYWFVTQKENNKNQYNFFYSTQNNHCWSTGVILIVRPLLSINRFQITTLSSCWGLPCNPTKAIKTPISLVTGFENRYYPPYDCFSTHKQIMLFISLLK